jgi:hypothetical protein
MTELAPLPKFRINQVVRLYGFKADIVGCWWDERKDWRYRVSVRRGPKRGEWLVKESSVKEEK